MLPSISENNSSFTRDRVQEVFDRYTYVPETGSKVSSYEFTTVQFHLWEDGGTLFSVAVDSRERKSRVRKWCVDVLTQVVANPRGHIAVLDKCLSDLVIKCSLRPDFRPDITHTALIENACNLLKRLPETPQEPRGWNLQSTYLKLPLPYLLGSATPSWQTLCATRYVDSNLLKITLWIESFRNYDMSLTRSLIQYCNRIAEILLMLRQLSVESPRPEWTPVIAFLWASWQRSFALLYHDHIHKVISTGDNGTYWIHTPDLDSNFSLRLSNSAAPQSTVPSHMCKWALRLLTSNKGSIGQDYRRAFRRYADTFSSASPRCTILADGTHSNCEGGRPESCLRLTGMRIKNQSAHALDCNGKCFRLYWNQSSWKIIGGSAAVCVEYEHDLIYRQTSINTMAISHVWSHGQGGRPENDPDNEGTGLNNCLHQRYRRIALEHGCDSYWMDTPCIPTNHDLRKEAIANINYVFETSKLTLVCDRDLMTIDVTSGDISAYEALLATIAVCDWNVRAWTLLEALRGRKNIHVLCKHDMTVSLRHVVDAVNQAGCIDIAAICMSTEHLLPTLPYIAGISEDHPEQQRAWVVKRRQGFISNIEEAAQVLSHRHASRPGDEIVIWSLLIGNDVFLTAEDLWRAEAARVFQPSTPTSRIDRPVLVQTGYLVSSIPRIANVKGLGWAPSRPNHPLHQASPTTAYTYILPYISEETNSGIIEEVGLRAQWSAYEFEVGTRLIGTLGRVASAFQKYRTIERAALQKLPKNQKWCALLQPMYRIWNRPLSHPGRTQHDVFVVVGSNDRKVWQWHGLLEIRKGIVLPATRTMELVIE